MAEDVWLKVKGYPIPDCYSRKDRLEIFERYYHRAVAQSQGE
jgi:glucose-6-phosphate isomerase